MNWDSGSYSYCLLSNFDTNKKVMVAKDAKGKVVSRAIMRLTKGSDDYISKKVKTKKRLHFKDVEEAATDCLVEEQNMPKEQLVLFLECSYSSLDKSQRDKVEREFMHLAKEKADRLGAVLVVSTSYDLMGLPELEEKSYYIFISYSKNGQQYLDSLTGQATESNAGDYKSAYVYISTTQDKS